MKDAYVDDVQVLCQIPIDEIQRSRRNYPNSQLLYKVHLFCDGLRGLSDLCLAFNSAELHIVSLRADKTGSIYCVIEDNGSVDLEWFEAELERAATLIRWTTQIDYLRYPFSRQA